METPTSLREAITFFENYENCHRFMVELRWRNGVVRCPRCGSEKVTYLENARRWKCYSKHETDGEKGKGQTFTLKTGTIFEDSPIGLEKWLPAAWLIIGCKNGISSYELAEALTLTQKTAWFVLHRLRLAMQTGTFEKMSGRVEADETSEYVSTDTFSVKRAPLRV
jgi:transposase-like protein